MISCVVSRHSIPKKKLNIESGYWMTPKPKTKINLGLYLELNSIRFGIEINKRIEINKPKIFDTQKFYDLKMYDIYENS